MEETYKSILGGEPSRGETHATGTGSGHTKSEASKKQNTSLVLRVVRFTSNIHTVYYSLPAFWRSEIGEGNLHARLRANEMIRRQQNAPKNLNTRQYRAGVTFVVHGGGEGDGTNLSLEFTHRDRDNIQGEITST